MNPRQLNMSRRCALLAPGAAVAAGPPLAARAGVAPPVAPLDAHPRPPLCRDCRFFLQPDDVLDPLTLGRCARAGEIELVGGAVRYEYAARLRAPGGGACGVSGQWFEPAGFDPDGGRMERAVAEQAVTERGPF